MGGALARALGAASPHELIWVFDIDPDKQAAFSTAPGVSLADSSAEVVDRSDILLLAIGPRDMEAALQEIAPAIRPSHHLVVSIAAGVTTKQVEAQLPPAARVVRVMPNIACCVGAMAAGFALGKHATQEDAERTQQVLEVMGVAELVGEDLIDAVTGLSGSGPAFVSVAIEALADGGVRVGLSRETAVRLAAQTVLGTARMVLELQKHPAQVKDEVASPGGTTIAGLHALGESGFRAALINAVEAATNRGTQMRTNLGLCVGPGPESEPAVDEHSGVGRGGEGRKL
jgi:pyrroline-5-carboxylate reductase